MVYNSPYLHIHRESMDSLILVTVKWGKEKYVLDLDTSEPVEDFKALLMSHTGVVPDRQKLILKGSILKDSWDSLKGLKQVGLCFVLFRVYMLISIHI